MTQGQLDPQHSELPDAVIDAICDQFEAAWLAQTKPRIEDYPSTTGEAIGQRLVQELLLAEFDLQQRKDVRPDRADYLRRFPSQVDLINGALSQHGTESESMGCDETKMRQSVDKTGCLCVRCPQCHSPVELVVDTPLAQIACSACGNDFSLVDDSTDQQGPAAGTTISHFRLLEKVGTGGFGSVWKAQDRELDRIVSIKIPRRGRLDAVEIEQFLREARAAAQLSHPNIVGIHEVGRDGEIVYIVSDFVDGEPLSEYLGDQSFSLREAAMLCSTISRAVEHAHQSGVIHRDLKPANIMLDAQRNPHLTDFGLARREADEVTMTCDGQVLGTPAYMSPELAQGDAHHADRRSDVYSLGVILFQLLTGALPFRGNLHMLIHQVIHEDAPSPRRLNSYIKQDLETICLKCLEKDPGRRYAAAHEVADELDRHLSGRPILARPITRPARLWKGCRRNPLTALLTVALASALLLGLIGMSWQWIKTRTEAERKRRLLYVSDISKIAEAWESGSVGVALNLLERHIPRPGERDLRGFEWRHLWQRCQPSLQAGTLESEPDFGIFALAVSPDGQFLAAAGGPDKVIVWELRTDKIVHRLKGHQYAVTGVAFSPDSRVLASSGLDNKTYLWNVDRGKQIAMLAGGAHGVTFSPEGKWLAVCTEDGVTMWDVSNHGKPVQRNFLRNPETMWSAAFSPDGKRVASAGHDGMAMLWDVESGRLLDTIRGHELMLWSASFDPGGQTLFTASADGMIKRWNLATRKQPVTLETNVGLVRLPIAFDPSGRYLAAARNISEVTLWDPASGKEMATFRRHGERISDLNFSPDGKMVASTSRNERTMLWDVETLRVWHQLDGAKTVAFAPDGRMLATGGPPGGSTSIQLWDVASGKLRQTLPGIGARNPNSLVFSPDGKILAAGGEALSRRNFVLWDMVTGKERAALEGHLGAVDTIAFSPDGKIVCTGGFDGKIKLWNPWTREELETSIEGRHMSRVKSVAFSPDGKTLASGSRDGTIRLWHVATGGYLLTLKGHQAGVEAVAFSADGKWLASNSDDGTIRLWPAVTSDTP